MQKARIAFRYGHFGDCFHGSQVQPGLPTVQGEFITAFRKLKWSDERMPVSMASRTDAGVHVRMNGGFIDIDAAKWQPMAEKGFLKAVGHQLPKSISLFDAKRVADEIVRITTNLSRMDESIKGHKQLSASVRKLEQSLNVNKYELVKLLNQPYNEGLNLQATFVSDDSLAPDESIITRIIKPQINYKGKLIQAAQVEVSVGE